MEFNEKMASEGEDEDFSPDGNPEMAEEGCLSRSVSPTSDVSVIMSSCQVRFLSVYDDQ